MPFVSDKIAFKTERLEAHFLNEDNKHFLFELYNDATLSQHLQGLDAEKDFALTIDCYNANSNIGAYLIFSRNDFDDTKDFIGFGGVHNQEPLKDGSLALPDTIEFLIMIDSKHARKGYAKEFSEAFLQLFFNASNHNNLMARVSKENEPCVNLLQRLGFKHEGETIYYSEENKFFLMRAVAI